MTPQQAMFLLGVDTSTLVEWTKRTPPLLHPIFTPGGHRRYSRPECEELRRRRGSEAVHPLGV
jgi:predicted site-specific integrase-resolvase